MGLFNGRRVPLYSATLTKFWVNDQEDCYFLIVSRSLLQIYFRSQEHEMHSTSFLRCISALRNVDIFPSKYGMILFWNSSCTRMQRIWSSFDTFCSQYLDAVPLENSTNTTPQHAVSMCYKVFVKTLLGFRSFPKALQYFNVCIQFLYTGLYTETQHGSLSLKKVH